MKDKDGTGRGIICITINPLSTGSRLGCYSCGQWERGTQTGPRLGQKVDRMEGGDWSDRQGLGGYSSTSGTGHSVKHEPQF